MDLKATAMLKLIYLEMFGHDMSWASFHVLEVMSSTKYAQKRVGYLAAAQSFRPDTDVLMLATNLLKKDVASALVPTITLPLLTIPHVITLSLADSLATDILPRLSHSSAGVRKKAVATVYRIALVYPDALKYAWPKMQELLMDDEQDSSVAAAIINVVCELGWRRPHDFLQLAPRLLELLVDGGNNWMAIKIIKLFASLTRTENRLIKKLVGPLINLIHTTPAMSLLYECINGVIEGGFLVDNAGTQEADDIASLCVRKLRGMIIVDGDPNLKYVSLLSFQKIITSHSHLVTTQEDVILACIDDADMSIRLKALELAAEMISSDNLIPLVDSLTRQLRIHQTNPSEGTTRSTDELSTAIADADPEIHLDKTPQPRLTTDYKYSVAQFILTACSKDNYANIIDFEWYIDVLMCLLEYAPDSSTHSGSGTNEQGNSQKAESRFSVHAAVGWQLQNIAVRVEVVRRKAVQAAQKAINTRRDIQLDQSGSLSRNLLLEPVVWIIGEFIAECANVQDSFNLLSGLDTQLLSASALCYCLQAIPKILSYMLVSSKAAHDPDRTPDMMMQGISFIGHLMDHPDVEVQERAVGFYELLKLGHSAISSEQERGAEGEGLLTQALPQFFSGAKLNPVAPSAQGKIALSSDVNLDSPINPNLNHILSVIDEPRNPESARIPAAYYYGSPLRPVDRLENDLNEVESREDYTELPMNHSEVVKRKSESQRMKSLDDPFHLQHEVSASHGSFARQHPEKEPIDIDSIPIVSLDIGSRNREPSSRKSTENLSHQQRFTVTQDETFGEDLSVPHGDRRIDSEAPIMSGSRKPKSRPLLAVDSREIGHSPLAKQGSGAEEKPDLEMARALAEVERLRMEMQRATERVETMGDVPLEGTLVKKRMKRVKRTTAHHYPMPLEADDTRTVSKRKKKVRVKKKPKSLEDLEDVVTHEEHQR